MILLLAVSVVTGLLWAASSAYSILLIMGLGDHRTTLRERVVLGAPAAALTAAVWFAIGALAGGLFVGVTDQYAYLALRLTTLPLLVGAIVGLSMAVRHNIGLERLYLALLTMLGSTVAVLAVLAIGARADWLRLDATLVERATEDSLRSLLYMVGIFLMQCALAVITWARSRRPEYQRGSLTVRSAIASVLLIAVCFGVHRVAASTLMHHEAATSKRAQLMQ